ncbi:Bifunctional protein GlmU [bacterium HR29]|jgi:bifunctional UDP-N-acetylglucosamine pyrophosphorylase/glucosamine-1-phosphate N-acetyltransferase|nr:Bifunctional protein GlmU [bacterium HR29]
MTSDEPSSRLNLGVAVLAAGRGTRMRSALPKVLHTVCGRPMVEHVVRAAAALRPRRIAVVVGYGAGQVREALASGEWPVVFVEQPELAGTGDAVARCRELLADCSEVLVLNGDSPLVTPALLERLLAARGESPMALVFARVPDVGRFGRLVRDPAGRVVRIEEAPPGHRGEPGREAERNAGQYAFDARWLWERVSRLPRSDSGEVYLTHLASLAAEEGAHAVAIEASAEEILGVDDRAALAEAERILRRRLLEAAMRNGVTIADPATTYLDADVEFEEDVVVLPGCHLFGRTRVGAGSVIGPGTVLRSAVVGKACRVELSVVEDSRLGDRVHVGPYSHIRGGADIGDDCFLGNFAEVKNSRLGPRVKMHHFSYVGDAEVGEETNIAAGTITCNFDGVTKHRTVIGRGVLLGSDTMLVAPVTVGDGARTGAGAVVTADIPPGALAVGVPARVVREDPTHNRGA